MNIDSKHPEGARGRARVLLVDDTKSLLIILERGLRRQGQVVYSAESGREALEVFQNNPIDIIICDLVMEGMDGREFSEAVRDLCEQWDVRKTPFILLTGWGEFVQSDLLAEAGVDRVMDKPVDLDELLTAIHAMTGAVEAGPERR